MYSSLRRKYGSLFVVGIFLIVAYRILYTSRQPPGASQHEKDSAAYREILGDSPPVHGTEKMNTISSNYSRALVIPRMKSEDVSWIAENFGDQGQKINAAVYIVDDPNAPLRPPINKGHEAMVYLSYIIDHYEKLADVNIFMHSHRHAWHNNDILENDAVEVIGRLLPEHVQRVGYMNLRCHWNPGCPDWIRPDQLGGNVNKQEEAIIAESWSELFPNDPVPKVLAQPCCAQFAVSKDRIRATPKERYLHYRDWLISTPLNDYLSGRIWEYLWHYLFTGETEYCPPEHVCYCEGFGVCFGGQEAYSAWWDKMWDKRHFEDELKQWYFRKEKFRQSALEHKLDEISYMPKPEPGENEKLQKTIMELQAWLGVEKQKAIERGKIPKNRVTDAKGNGAGF